MPEIDVSGFNGGDQLALIARHLFERLDELNLKLHAIAEALDAINSRLSYATVLDNND